MISNLSGGCSIEGLCMQLVKDGAIQQIKGRLKLLEESLQGQIAEFKSDFSDKDIGTAARQGRWVS